ncbi:MAG: endopeptidase La [Myxococcota bacterium]
MSEEEKKELEGEDVKEERSGAEKSLGEESSSLMEKRKILESGEPLGILAVRNMVLYPNMVLPLMIAREKSVALVEEVASSHRLMGIVAQKDPEIEEPATKDLYDFGCAGHILKMIRFPDGSIRVLVQGVTRLRIKEYVFTEPYFKAKVEVLEEIEDVTPEFTREFEKLKKLIKETPILSRETTIAAMNLEKAGMFTDYVATNIDLELEDMQKLLRENNVLKRIKLMHSLVRKQTHKYEIRSSIDGEVRSQMDKSQREYYLRQQLKAIKRELGEEGDIKEQEIDELRKRLDEAQLPEQARKEADRELNRLQHMHPESAEYTVTRTYLDWLCELPWKKSTKDNLDIDNAQKILNEDHWGMTKPKERILEYLAVRKLKNDMKGPILCLVGPPGVGKTSLGRSVARAMGRKFERIALGGMRDEAEIRGHRRTYVGALPGRIIQSLRRTKTNNPVIILDEIDKLGADFRGDPSSALLEVLDPEQNFTFTDHYLDLEFDLSKVLFIATANLIDPVPGALKDRMEVLELPGYTEDEKLQIAKRHLVPKQISEHGLTEENIEFTDEGIKLIINGYTREAGVRNLEREIASLCRKVAKEVARGKAEKVILDEKKVEEFLSHRKFYSDLSERTDIPGVAVGLAWTPFGGDILFIEATKMDGSQKFAVTGKLGDVMNESAQAAFTFVRAKSKELKIPEDFFKKSDFHVHIPSGAIPKDGPSAGITIATALASLCTGIPVRSDTAMTGEITLRGKVLPVGGIKEKVLAAHRAEIKRIILPKRNVIDLDDVPEEIKKTMEFVSVENVVDVWANALEKVPWQ